MASVTSAFGTLTSLGQLESSLSRNSKVSLGPKDSSSRVLSSPFSNSKSSRGVRVNAELDPPPTRKFTGYVEKDSAGQTNIYAVEPDLYVSKSAISTNSQGSSSEGSGGTLIISGFLAVAAISGAAAVLMTVNNSQSAPTPSEIYSGPPLNFYIQKFQSKSASEALVEASVSAPEITEAVVSTPVITEEDTPVVEAALIEVTSVDTAIEIPVDTAEQTLVDTVEEIPVETVEAVSSS